MAARPSYLKAFVFLLQLGSLAGALLAQPGCGSDAAPEMETPEDASDAPARRALLRSLSEQVILPSYKNASSAAAALSTAASKFAASPDDANRKAVQAAWTKAMLAWEHAEVLQLGPASSVGPYHPGGANLRDQIYFWPVVDSCGIDRCLVTKCYEQKDFASASLPNVRTLSALEILLFDARTETACPPDHKVVTAKAWQGIAKELDARRAAYARACAADVLARTSQLVKEYGDTFEAELTSAGEGSELFETSLEATDALAVALLYISSYTKDRKLARAVFCTSESCASETEHPYAKVSKESIAANLEALGDVMQGMGGAKGGLYGFASARGAVQFPAKLEVLLYDAQSAVNALPGTLEEAVTTHSAESKALFQAVEDLSSYLKSDMPSALDVELPDAITGISD